MGIPGGRVIHKSYPPYINIIRRSHKPRAQSKFHDWRKPYGLANEHNALVPGD